MGTTIKRPVSDRVNL